MNKAEKEIESCNHLVRPQRIVSASQLIHYTLAQDQATAPRPECPYFPDSGAPGPFAVTPLLCGGTGGIKRLLVTFIDGKIDDGF